MEAGISVMNNRTALTVDPVSGHSSGVRDYQGSRPNNLFPDDRTFSDDRKAPLWSPSSHYNSSDENNSPTALNTFNWDKPAMEDKSVDFGSSLKLDKNSGSREQHRITKKQDDYAEFLSKSHKKSHECKNDKSPKKSNYKLGDSCRSLNGCMVECEKPLKSSKNSIIDSTVHDKLVTELCDTTSDCTLSDNERSEEDDRKQKENLKNAAWFQAGISREIALEVLAAKPEGSFIVRESTTKIGCYALSLRVPPSKNPDGIAHYLILRTKKGYKIKGFTKDFSTLQALITHHSIMPEMLPCPLALDRHLVRDAENEFEDTEQKPCDIFTDIHWIMDDLEIRTDRLND